MTVSIEQYAKDTITKHAEGGYPNEICGILLGKDSEGHRVILNAMPIENSFESDEQYHRFRITPQAMFAAEKLARRDRMDVLGVYHSHPDSPAQPSEYDKDHAAWTSWTYIIISIRDGNAAEMRAWRLEDDRSAFNEIELAVTG
ncbi:MAG: M67 family metallopeptidase [Chloroflexia bacterium]